jgi:wobble nucleotide-excising tRNase
MSAELQSALVGLVYALMIAAYSLNILILSKAFGWFNEKTITLKGGVDTKLKGEVTTGAADNVYTELAARENKEAAKHALETQKIALETAKTEERTEQARLERARLEGKGSS